MVPLQAVVTPFAYPQVVPPSTVIQFFPVRSRHAFPAQKGTLIFAPVSNRMVTGDPLDPLPCAVSGEAVMVPHKCTVVPGPIWAEPVPQLLELLKKLTALASAQSAPLAAPLAVGHEIERSCTAEQAERGELGFSQHLHWKMISGS